MTTTEAISELRKLGWDAVADDLADGVGPLRVLQRLGDVGEYFTEAGEIVSSIDDES